MRRSGAPCLRPDPLAFERPTLSHLMHSQAGFRTLCIARMADLVISGETRTLTEQTETINCLFTSRSGLVTEHDRPDQPAHGLNREAGNLFILHRFIELTSH